MVNDIPVVNCKSKNVIYLWMCRLHNYKEVAPYRNHTIEQVATGAVSQRTNGRNPHCPCMLEMSIKRIFPWTFSPFQWSRRCPHNKLGEKNTSLSINIKRTPSDSIGTSLRCFELYFICILSVISFLIIFILSVCGVLRFDVKLKTLQ